MAFGFGGVPDVFDFAIGADQKGAADGAGKDAAHEFLGAPHTVIFDHFVGGVTEEIEVEFLFGFEFCLRRLAIGAGAQDYGVQLVEFFLCVAKLGRFRGSTGSVGLGIEEKYDAATGEIFESEVGTAVGFEFEVWSLLSDF